MSHYHQMNWEKAGKEERERYSKEAVPGCTVPFVLWEADGSSAASIRIEKRTGMKVGDRLWMNVNDGIPGSFPVFHVYVVDIHGAVKVQPDSGGRIRPYNKPYMNFDQAMRAARRAKGAMIRSGKWVLLESLRGGHPLAGRITEICQGSSLLGAML